MEEQDRVLVVDDDPGMRWALQRTLGAHYRLAMASNFEEALRHVRDDRFEVALIDVQLNDGDGYTLCRKVRKLSPDTDVILMTGSISHPDEKLYRSLEEDAFYFLFKPFDRRVMRALLERCLRLQKERKAKEDYARELADDLEKARRFQQSLLPPGPAIQAGWHVQGLIEQCDALGGDLYFCQPQPDGTILFGVSDVVGHGVSAAMYAGMLLSSLNAARRRADRLEDLIAELLANLDFFEDSRYASLFFGKLFPDGKLRYFNAGHPPAFCKRLQGGIQRLESTGLLLSKAFRKQAREVKELRLEPSESVLIYTDGAYETLDCADQELGISGLEAAFGQQSGMNVDRALESLASFVLDHCAGRPLDDDLTLLMISREISDRHREPKDPKKAASRRSPAEPLPGAAAKRLRDLMAKLPTHRGRKRRISEEVNIHDP